jgi:hypothetical protein
LGLLSFEEGFSVDLFGFLISLPTWFNRWHREPEEMLDRWGFYWEGGNPSLVLCWKNYCKFIHMPWRFEHEITEVRRADGSWAKQVQSYDKGEPDQREICEFPYFYAYRQGDHAVLQEVTATCYVSRSMWKRKWLPWMKKTRMSLEITFSDEVGGERGSWKGGCIGCGWEFLPNDTMESCLRRMERERHFR